MENVPTKEKMSQCVRHLFFAAVWFDLFAGWAGTAGSENEPNSWPFTLWLFNIAMENGPFIDDFPIKTTIYRGFSI